MTLIAIKVRILGALAPVLSHTWKWKNDISLKKWMWKILLGLMPIWTLVKMYTRPFFTFINTLLLYFEN